MNGEKPFLLHIGSSGLGENLMATPAMEYLARKFRIVLIIRENFAPLFKLYPFLHEVIGVREYSPGREGFRLTEQLRKHLISSYAPGFYFSHFISSEKYFATDPDLTSYFSAIPTLNTGQFSTVRTILIRAGVKAEDFPAHDLRIRRPTAFNRSPARKIILYQGSQEHLRRLPKSSFMRLQNELLPFAAQGYEIHGVYNRNYAKEIEKIPGIHYLETAFEYDSLAKVMELFSTGIDLMIGPDSGLTNLAHAYGIPMIWFETRDRVEMIIDPIHYPDVSYFRKLDPECTRQCPGAKHAEQYGPEPQQMRRPIKDSLGVQNLPCFQDRTQPAPCLSFNEADYEKIIRLVRERLTGASR